MKKALLIFLLILTVFAAGACKNTSNDSGNDKLTSSSQSSEAVPENTSEDSSASSDGVFVCEFETGEAVTLGKALPELGEYLSYAEAASCIHPGTDKVYSYEGFTVTTSPDADGNDLVSEIALVSDAAVLKNGIKIGCDKSVVVAAFGDDFTEDFGVMKYEFDNAVISAVLDDSSAVASFVVSAVQ